MSTQTEITRIETARNTLRTKAVELGIAESSAKIDALATAYNNIVNRGTVNPTVKEGESYTIQPGYYAGGTVAGVAGGGNYSLQEKTVTPTKNQQSVAADEGYYGLAEVIVAPIPQNFQDVSSVTATAAQVLANAVFVTSDGTVTPGTMPNNGAVTKILSIGTESYTIPAGYHNGEGTVSIVTETKSAVPSETEQTISATAGKVLSSVTVAPIPAQYKNAVNTTAVEGDILTGKTAVIKGQDVEGNPIAVEVEGTMPDNGAIAETMDGLSVTEVTIPAGYTSGGTVTLTDAIEKALAAI